MTKWRVKRDVAIRELPGGDAVVARAEGAEAVIINTTAHAILELLAHEATEQEIADAFVRTFPGEAAHSIHRDVHALIARLARDGILEPCGTASSTA